MSIIELENITKSYENHVAVDDLSLHVPAGSIYGFIGPNGLLKCSLARSHPGNSGQVRSLATCEEVWLRYYKKSSGKPRIPYNDAVEPGDFMRELKKNRNAHKNFMNFTPSSRRMYIGWLNSARRPETRIRRIERIVELSERNIKPGMNVI